METHRPFTRQSLARRGPRGRGLAGYILLLAVGCAGEDPSNPDPGAHNRDPRADLEAASLEPVRITENKYGQPQELKGKFRPPSHVPADPAARARWFLDEFGELFGVQDPNSELAAREVKPLEFGNLNLGSFVITSRMVEGVPVYGSDIRTRVDQQGDIDLVLSHVPTQLSPPSTTPRITEGQAAQAAIADLPGAEAALVDLWILSPSFIGENDPNVYLAWRVITAGAQGAIGQPGASVTRFVNALDGTRLPFEYPMHFEVGFTVARKEIPMSPAEVNADPAARSIAETAQCVFELYEGLGHSGWDGRGTPPLIDIETVHPGIANAAATSGGLAGFQPEFATCSIAAHEFGHWFVEMADGQWLSCGGERAAWAEGLADCMSALTRAKCGVACDDEIWAMTDIQGSNRRSFSAPETTGGAGHYTQRKGREHLDGGIAGRLCHMLAEGGSNPVAPPEDAGFTTQGMGADKLLVALRVWMSGFFQPCADFETGANTLARVFADLAEAEGQFDNQDCLDGVNAVNAVGISDVGEAICEAGVLRCEEITRCELCAERADTQGCAWNTDAASGRVGCVTVEAAAEPDPDGDDGSTMAALTSAALVTDPAMCPAPVGPGPEPGPLPNCGGDPSCLATSEAPCAMITHAGQRVVGARCGTGLECRFIGPRGLAAQFCCHQQGEVCGGDTGIECCGHMTCDGGICRPVKSGACFNGDCEVPDRCIYAGQDIGRGTCGR